MSFLSKKNLLLFALFLLVAIQACKDDPALPDNLISFESNQLGFTSTENEITLQVKFSYPAYESGTILINTLAEGLVYDIDFTTEPATVSNAISIPFLAGETAKTIKVIKKPGLLVDGDENIGFTLAAAPASMILGPNPNLKLTFAEIVSAASAATVDGGGASYPNKVFIDLSANRQTAMARTGWDLGFAAGNEFRVILNSSNGMMAIATDKNSMAAVTAADTAGLSTRLSLSAVFAAINLDPVPDWIPNAITWIDDPSGDLTKTALAEISATDADNKVYIVNLGSGPGTPAPDLGWKKIRVLRKAAGYTLQHADIGATTFSEVTVSKDNKFNFQYVDFEKGSVQVEPQKDKWDISWTAFTNSTNLGTGLVPYYFQDIILQNTNQVQTVQILTSVISYETFSESNLAALDFGAQSQVKIGANWRSGGGPGSGPAIRTDRFYIIKDQAGNVYKLRFTALTSEGERGKPKYEYSLVRKG